MIALDAPGMLAPAFLPDAFISPQSITALRFASAGFYSATTDTPALEFFEPRILGDIEIGQSAADAVAVGGRVALTVSEIALADADGFAADLARYGIADGRQAWVFSIPVNDASASDFGTSLASAAVPFSGIVRQVDRTGAFAARLALNDITERLSTPLQPTLYQGTSGTEGGADLKGKPKPVALGQVFNVAPVFLGNVNLGAGSARLSGAGPVSTRRIAGWRRNRRSARRCRADLYQYAAHHPAPHVGKPWRRLWRQRI
jgi:hypothetical protein